MSETPSSVLVDLRRGALVESRHHGIYAVVDTAGRLIDSSGDTGRVIYARSAIKPLQALPLVESGTPASDEDLAIACASHGGEERHVAVVSAWLVRLGLSEADLECGAHAPSYAPAARALYAAGQRPTQLHNNCSGKHTGMLATCRHTGETTLGYIGIDHPAQKRVRHALEEMCGLDLRTAPVGIDGCGLPQFGLPLDALALAFARFGAPDDLPADRAAACRRLGAAILKHPFLIAGTGRFCTRAIEICNGKVLLKTGAEGVFAAAIPARGIGIAVKIDDGAGRAAEVALAALLARHAGLSDSEVEALQPLLKPAITNVAGRIVGMLEPAKA